MVLVFTLTVLYGACVHFNSAVFIHTMSLTLLPHCSPACTAGCVSYNNLTAVEWLFDGTGDHQFEVYRLMRDETR